MPIRAVSFDFWHTLFTEQQGGFGLYQSRRISLLADAIRAFGEFHSSDLEHAFRVEAESHNRTWREEHRTISAAERIGRILTHLQVQLPEGMLSNLASAYEEGILERPPMLVPGAKDTLHKLSRSFKLGIISDVGYSPGRVLKQVLRTEGLLDLFDSLVFSDEAGLSKPHSEVFHRTARALGAGIHEMVHIGDLERTDIVGAKDAGYYAIRFTGATPMLEGEATIADAVTDVFESIPTILEGMTAS